MARSGVATAVRRDILGDRETIKIFLEYQHLFYVGVFFSVEAVTAEFKSEVLVRGVISLKRVVLVVDNEQKLVDFVEMYKFRYSFCSHFNFK